VSNLTREFWASTIDGITLGSIYALIALGYTLVYGVLRLINFAHAEIFMIGTFATYGLVTAVGITSPLTGFALVLMLLAAAVVSAGASGLSAVVLERVAYRPLRKRGAGQLSALISAIGASLFLQQLFALQWADRVTIPRVMEKSVLFEIGSGTVRSDKALIVVGALVMMFVLDRFVNRTRFGRGIRATAQDPETAVLMGVNIDRVIMLTFLVGGAMAGIAGMLYMIYFEGSKFSVGFILGIKAFTAAVLGGIGNLRGALVGGLTLGLVESYGASILGAQWKDVIAFVVLVVVLMFRPTGILGEKLGRARA
jgi:branched-chain amino acid transport system permease protein